MPYIKQIVAVRRRGGLTRKEFFDYHFQVHGKLTQGPSPEATPSKYFQTHIEDAAYKPQQDQVPNANPWWAFSDDVIELYFQSEDHLNSVYGSEHVRKVVGPDGANFSDFGAALPITVQERNVPIQGASLGDIDPLVGSSAALYFISTANIDVGGLIVGFADCLQQFASSQVRSLVANTPADLRVDTDAYFRSNPNRPKFNLIFSVLLHGKEGLSDVRKAQTHFEEVFGSDIQLENTWIAFGQRGLVFDQDNSIQVCDYAPSVLTY
ncbi:hypothetical protein F53441_11611 [Fusarium austroafricanum]|uniref:EthD domain-containing protein n=1 Tax=Fusarium austroafricanum TaxID=2364996 RepID=A0A8H4NZ82_9HYPO|nr:hypothetical protein F53441_11611 [Fusarium austroafricanum]